MAACWGFGSAGLSENYVAVCYVAGVVQLQLNVCVVVPLPHHRWGQQSSVQCSEGLE